MNKNVFDALKERGFIKQTIFEDELYETDYNIHEMVKNANTYINKLDTIVPVTCYIKKSKKSELRKIVDELNREIN